jgi:hypothetical protein
MGTTIQRLRVSPLERATDAVALQISYQLVTGPVRTCGLVKEALRSHHLNQEKESTNGKEESKEEEVKQNMSSWYSMGEAHV